MPEKFRYRVTHPTHGTHEAAAEDKLRAIHAAAKAWGVPWTSVARECEYERLEAVRPNPEKKPAPKRRPATQKKGGGKP